MRVLIVSQYFLPENFRINDVATLLIERGCTVDVLTGHPNYPQGKTFAGYHSYEARAQAHPDGYYIARVPIVPRGSGGSIRLSLNYASFVLSASTIGQWLLRGRQYDAIFVYGASPILQAVPGLVFKAMKRAPMAVWVQDLWPGSLEATGRVRNRPALGLVGKLTDWIYRRADLLFIQSRAFEEEVTSRSGGHTPVCYMPNPADLGADRSGDVETAPRGKGAPFDVMFAGNLGRAQALPTILRAAELLEDNPSIRLVLAGQGSLSAWLRQQVDERGLRNVQLCGQLSPDAAADRMRNASALLLTLGKSETLERTIPSKLSTYLAMGRPVVSAADGEVARIVREAQVGIAVAAEDAGALAKAILTMYERSDLERETMGRNGRSYYSRNFEPRAVVGQLLDQLEQMTANHGRHGNGGMSVP